MCNNLSSITEAFTLYVICAIACCAGCTEGSRKVPAVSSAGEVLLRVTEQVYDGGWKTAGEVIVRRDGSYERTIQDLGKMPSASRATKGHLPDSLMRVLEEDVAKHPGFKIVNGVPTYQYGIDDNHVRHPAGVAQLLRFAAERGGGKGSAPKSWWW